MKSNQLCGAKSANICVIIFTNPETHKAETEHLKPVLQSFTEDPVSFAYVDISKEPLMQKDVFGGSKAVLYKSKRSKYMELPVGSADQMRDAISDALGGGGTWEKVS